MPRLDNHDLICIKYLTVEQFRDALPHLQALHARWLARPIGMWSRPQGASKTCEPEHTNEQIACHNFALIEPHPGHPTWWKAMYQGMELYTIHPFLDGNVVQVVLYLLDVFTGQHATLVY